MSLQGLADTFKTARGRFIAGTAAVAMLAVPFAASAPAQAQDTSSPPGITLTTSDYQQAGMFAPNGPTEQRPYYYYRLDAATKAAYPNFSPVDIAPFHNDKLVVLNFIDESFPASALQTQILQRSIAALATESRAKELMLVDVVTRDAQGRNVYGAAFGALYDGQNQLGPNNTPLPTWVLPYGVVYGEPLSEGGSNRLFDFALLNGVRNDVDLNNNIKGIGERLYATVVAYNRKF